MILPTAETAVDAGLVASIRGLTSDGRRLFATRVLRMFGYGSMAVVLVLYLAALGLDDLAIGIVLTLTLVGDTLISLWLTTHADRIGRRRVLVAGSLLMVGAAVVFAVTSWAPLLVVAATIGVISPTGNEVGPFLAVEQAALSETTPDARRTPTFAWYNLAGYVATATGALAAGLASQALLAAGAASADAYRAIVIGYAVVGLAMAAVFSRVGSEVEAPHPAPSGDSVVRRLGLGRSKGIVARLSALFALDAFGGGFIPQSLMAYWFHLRYGVEPAVLGGIFFSANLLAAVSSLSASRIAARIGLVNTMVFTHLPSNVLLILVPLMPNLPLAIAVLLLRFSLSQMDVPTRQSYVMAVVEPDERSAAAGVTGIARTTGAALSPALSAPLVGTAALASVPFFLAGGLKIAYDLLLYRAFRSGRAPDERARVG
ncbi:MAG TPA: MFS transporter [Candidatus Limnocylindrales bacterium]|jgi:MFS family permease|nr:MFS transporter [Candidatus Limnocylindrales bacterium]